MYYGAGKIIKCNTFVYEMTFFFCGWKNGITYEYNFQSDVKYVKKLYRGNVTIFNYEPTMILLIGIWISLTKNPMKPMMQKPIAVAIAIFWNSLRSGFVHRFTNRSESLANKRAGSQNLITWSILFDCFDYISNDLVDSTVIEIIKKKYQIRCYLSLFEKRVK